MKTQNTDILPPWQYLVGAYRESPRHLGKVSVLGELTPWLAEHRAAAGKGNTWMFAQFRRGGGGCPLFGDNPVFPKESKDVILG